MNIRSRVISTAIGLSVVLAALLPASASAAAAPVWNLDIHHNETNFAPGATSHPEYWLGVNNVGAAASSGVTTVTIHLPSGITREQMHFAEQDALSTPFPHTSIWSCPGSAGQTTVTCSTASSLPPHTMAYLPLLAVNVNAGASGDRFVTATVAGGGASAPANASELTHISATPAPFGIVDGSFAADFYEADGVTPVRGSGAHPDLATFGFDFNTVSTEIPSTPFQKLPNGTVRDLRVDLPPGFLGNPTAVAECTPGELTGAACPIASQVGRFDALVHFAPQDEFEELSTGVFNMTHPNGVIADLAFSVGGNPVHVRASLDPRRNYAIKSTVSNINETVPVFHQQLTLWGDPADPSHDSERCPLFSDTWGGDVSGSCAAGIAEKPFLTAPFDCTAANQMTLSEVDSWQSTGVFGPAITNDLPGSPTGCDASQAQFEPGLTITPTNTEADTPTGLDVEASVPQDSDPHGVATPPVKRLQVTLPQGMSLNPSFADGLDGCTEAEIGISHAGVPDDEAVTCPDQSRIGAVELSSPLLPEPLQGSIYLAKQSANPLNSLFALYAVVHDTENRGVLVKLPGSLSLDPATGQATTTFDGLPEFPVDHLSVQFRGGDRAPLINPPTCGTKTIAANLQSWAQPGTEVPATSSYDITQGPGGGPCSPSAGSRPFAPKLSAGTEEPLAGAYSPLVLRLTRSDGEQELTRITADLPKGLLGRLAGVLQCPDATLAAIPTAPGTGAAEKAAPSCPAGSRIGRLNAGSGAGPLPFYIPGSLYLAGPYKGAPLSVAAVTPAVAGGIDLGNVVIRTALYVDPTDAHIHAVSDPIPTILHGVPIHLRDVRLVLDRPNFTLNPTNCTELPFSGQAGGSGADLADPADDTSAPLADRFQVGGCGRLGFEPKLSFKLKGGTHRGDHPAFFARLTARPGDANIASAVTALPHSEFLENAHIKTICTRVQFAADACPAASIYGYVKAVTPLLDQPVEGPLYLRSSDNTLPDLVAKLNGQISADLVGRIDSIHGGIRTTFSTVPDVPVTEFTLSMQGGKKGLLVNSRNLCKRPSRADVAFTGQNGKTEHLRPPVQNSCKGHGKHKGAHSHRPG